MKRRLSVFFFFLAGIFTVSAQEIDAKVKKAVDDLAIRLNRPIEVSIETPTIDGSDSPTALSRYLANKANVFAASNKLYRVKTASSTRGINLGRTGGSDTGKITGTYTVLGDSVEVTFNLVSSSDNTLLGSQAFVIPKAELDKLGLAIVPANFRTEQEVKKQEEILAPIATAAQASVPLSGSKDLLIDVWPNSETRTYYDGEELCINLWASHDCYVKVYHIDAEKKTQMIFPNRLDNDNFLRANTEMLIPRNGGFRLHAPFGQETIVAYAQDTQFTNLENEMVQIVDANGSAIAGIAGGRGLSIQAREQNSPPSLSASARFTFTILEPSAGEEIFSYPKPANMTETVQSLRSEIVRQGGSFNGNEREGSFSSAGARGTYRLSGNNIIVTLREQRNAQSQPSTRGLGDRGFRFSFAKPPDLPGAVRTVKNGISQKGGSFNGDERGGNFQASGIAGEYNVADQVHVNILEKPFIISNSLIEREVKNFFGVR
ncbi:MAG: DUF4384 domain-containing protein [Treponema sp.]|jgi:hypothetical protein|nr:DUF4384 domain-containing protein [Treponema sp.]